MTSDLEKLHVLQCKRKQYNVLAECLAQWGCYLLWSVSTVLGNTINKLEFNCRTHLAALCLACQEVKWEEDPHLSLVYDHTLFAWTKRQVEVSYLNSFIFVTILKLNQEQPHYNLDRSSFETQFSSLIGLWPSFPILEGHKKISIVPKFWSSLVSNFTTTFHRII